MDRDPANAGDPSLAWQKGVRTTSAPALRLPRGPATLDLHGHRLGRLGAGRCVVLVVPPEPQIGRRLRVALRRVLPVLLAPERGDVEVCPGTAQRLVAATVDEVGAEDPIVVVAIEDVGAVPLA